MFISTTWAQTAGQAGAPGTGGFQAMMEQAVPFVILFIIFYFLLIRPQQKRVKEQQNMIASIKKGDRIITSGGIIGVVRKADDLELEAEIAEGVVVKVVRSMVANVLTKDEPVKKQ